MIKSVLTSIPMKGRVTFCVIVDLSKVKTIWGTLEVCFAAIESISGENIEVILLGGKYDILKNYGWYTTHCGLARDLSGT